MGIGINSKDLLVPVGGAGSGLFIKPLDQDGNNSKQLQQQQHQLQNLHQQHLLLAPPTALVPKLGQIGRNASADYDGAGSSGAQGGFEDNNLRRNVLGRSVSEKIGHKSDLMSQVQRTAWARHTTK